MVSDVFCFFIPDLNLIFHFELSFQETVGDSSDSPHFGSIIISGILQVCNASMILQT